MNIQRKYSLPNCTLLLEGLSDASRAAHFQELRPVLSILVNVECFLSAYNQPLVGGREFFESLVRAVSGYAQQVLSNVTNPLAYQQQSELVELQKIDSNKHRLIVHPEIGQGLSDSNHNKPPIQIDLNTVQLFDLVEAVDQFFADSQTLPELRLELQPAARRYGGASEALVKQAVPAGVGVTSLAAAALVFGLIPAPEVRPPQTTAEKSNTSASPGTSPSVANNSTLNKNFNQQPAATPAATPKLATPTPNASPGVNKDLEALLSAVPEITDPSQLRSLNRQVYNQINPAWANRTGLNQDLVYRVGVAADGAVVGYKAVNTQANQAVDQTPLPKLLYNPASQGAAASEPIAQFRVVFTRQGILQVSPWRGYSKTPDVFGTKITDANAVKDLNQKLYQTLRQNWSGTPNFTQNLKYRVAINSQGVIADYEPLNKAAIDYSPQTPLPKIFKELYGSNLAPPNTKDPLAHFQVVFKSNGELEVKPWEGYR